jgi:hypothetical protein
VARELFDVTRGTAVVASSSYLYTRDKSQQWGAAVVSLITQDKISNRDDRSTRLLRSIGKRVPDPIVDTVMRVHGS